MARSPRLKQQGRAPESAAQACVMASRWIARYEEGYVTRAGEWVLLERRDVREHAWASPADALLHWERSGEFQRKTMARYRNGKQEIDDVSKRPEFSRLGVAKVWRRLTFVLPPNRGMT